MKTRIIIVGGGSSGLMAACTAAEAGAEVTLLEQNPSLGKKLLLTGGGRCNVTNNRPEEEIIRHIPGNGKFLHSSFTQFSQYDIMTFFIERGVALKEEDHGRMFPVTDKARTILEAFIEELKRLQVQIRTNIKVERILIENEQVTGVLLEDGEILRPIGLSWQLEEKPCRELDPKATAISLPKLLDIPSRNYTRPKRR